MQNNTLIITGTDTGIGKTILTATLLHLLRKRGENAVMMKPVQTGREEYAGNTFGPDLAAVRHLTGWSPPDEDLPRLVPYSLEIPCSPHLAAEHAGIEIDPDRILEAHRSLTEQADRVLVEGAGGLLAPLNYRVTMLDLFARIGAPVVLAARPNLGTLNHTLLSARALAEADLTLAGVVMVKTTDAEPDFIEQDNLKTLRRMLDAPVLGPLPFIQPGEPLSWDPAVFQQKVERFDEEVELTKSAFQS